MILLFSQLSGFIFMVYFPVLSVAQTAYFTEWVGDSELQVAVMQIKVPSQLWSEG
jgi:hypothetical protein